MDAFADYYICESGGGSCNQEDIFGTVYVTNPYVQRGQYIYSFLEGQFRAVKPLAIRGARALGNEALNTGHRYSQTSGTSNPRKR